MILVLIGRSASGKSTIAKNLEENYGYVPVRTATTRPRREGESENAYYFMHHDEFMEHVAKDEFVEWDTYDMHCYGTLRSELRKETKQVIVITPEGAKHIKEAFPDAFVVLVSVDLKTSAIRAIAREKVLTSAKLGRIAMRANSDEYVYADIAYDYVCQNSDGTSLDDIVQEIADEHIRLAELAKLL